MKIVKYAWIVAVMVFCGMVVAVGFMFVDREESKALENIPGVQQPSPSKAAEYHNLKYAIIGVGAVIEAFLAYWIWRIMRVERAKYKLIGLVLSGKMTVEEVAKKLGVSREVVKDAVKELKKEGVVE